MSSNTVFTKYFSLHPDMDLPDIRRMVHYGATSDISQYVQETCRAGRIGEHSQCAGAPLMFSTGLVQFCLSINIELCFPKIDYDWCDTSLFVRLCFICPFWLRHILIVTGRCWDIGSCAYIDVVVCELEHEPSLDVAQIIKKLTLEFAIHKDA